MSSLQVLETPAAARGTLRFELFFYLGVPGLIGFMLGWIGAGAAGDWPKPVAIVTWVLLSVLGWLASDLGTRVMAPLLRPLGWPLVAVLALGVIASGLVAVPMNFAVGELISGLGYAAPGFDMLAQYSVSRAVDGLVAPLIIWTSVNLVIFHAGRRSIYGYAHAHAPAPALQRSGPVPSSPTVAAPAFLRRVRSDRRGRLIALQAELHYVRVFTDHGEDLIPYRFGEAVREAAALGMCVHRSWWVAADCVAGFRGGERPRLLLTNGLEVPVSRAHRQHARTLAGPTG